MTLEPWFELFPACAALTMAGLCAGLYARRKTMGGMWLDWVAAFAFGALAFLAALVAGLSDWSDAADFTVAFVGAAAGFAFVAAFSGLFQRFTRGQVGSPTFRWLLFSAALGLEGFGWGALAASPGLPGNGLPASWAVVPVAAALACLLPLALLAARELVASAGTANTVQFVAGALLLSGGFLALSLGDALSGSALGMAGGAFLYSGAAAVVGRAPAASGPVMRPRVEEDEAPRPRAGPGTKVRVPKGAAVRVSAFRDDDLPVKESE